MENRESRSSWEEPNTSPYTEITFLGREHQIAQFEELLRNRGDASSPWIVEIVAPGGMGKTQLLLQYLRLARERELFSATNLIDLFFTQNQLEQGLLRSIAEQLAPHVKSQLTDPKLDGFDRATQGLVSLDDGFDDFLKDTRRLSSNKVVLFFDTAENVSDPIWRVLTRILSGIRAECPNFLVVVARRSELDAPYNTWVDFRSIDPQLIRISLEGLDIDLIDGYFKQQLLPLPRINVEQIHALSKGKPILVALVADWLRDGNRIDEITSFDLEKFEDEMVRKVASLRSPQDETILVTAHFSRRLNSNMLAELFALSSDEAAKRLREISRFSFVKYQEASGQLNLYNYSLHDEMVRLIEKHVWSTYDPLGSQRKSWSQKMDGYYEKAIQQSQVPIEQYALIAERLHYTLSHDVVAANDYAEELFKKLKNRDPRSAIVAEFERNIKILPRSIRRRHISRRARLEPIRNNPEKAIELHLQLINDSECELDLQAASRARVIELIAEKQSPIRAIENGLEYIGWFDQQLQLLGVSHPSYKTIVRDFGLLHNNVGLACRKISRIEDTRTHYTKAIEKFNQAGNSYGEIATTRNNLAYVYYLLGDFANASANCDSAIEISKKLNDKVRLGLCYNVFGIIRAGQLIEEEAVKFFDLALEIFEQENWRRGVALVSLAYGRMLTLQGWLKHGSAKAEDGKEFETYHQAGKMLDQAIAILRMTADVQYLCEALNERGTLARHQRQLKEAESFFLEGIEISRDYELPHLLADNWQDLAHVEWHRHNLDKAFEQIKIAQAIAQRDSVSPQALARAKRLEAYICFERKEYDSAFAAAVEACINFSTPDPSSPSDNPSRRQLLYNDMRDWVARCLLLIKSIDRASQFSQSMLATWTAVAEPKMPEDFKLRLESIVQNYEFLISNPE